MLRAGVVDHSQSASDIIGVATALRGQRDPLPHPLQKRKAEIPLQETELVADGATRQIKLVGGAPHGAMPGEALQGAQRLHRRKPHTTSLR
jgi:hypothetical protein